MSIGLRKEEISDDVTATINSSGVVMIEEHIRNHGTREVLMKARDILAIAELVEEHVEHLSEEYNLEVMDEGVA